MKKRNRVLALTMAAAMSASLLAGCGSSTQQDGAAASSEASASTTAAADGEEDNIIRVGVVCSMTGGSAIYGEGAQNAIDMAVEEINGGDSGYKIEIVNGGKVADDAKDAKQAMNAYNKVMRIRPRPSLAASSPRSHCPWQSRPPRTVCCFWRPVQPTPMSP